MMTANQARDILKNEKNEDKAWKAAQQDEGLNEGVTKEQWLAWAYKANTNEEAQRIANQNAVYVD